MHAFHKTNELLTIKNIDLNSSLSHIDRTILKQNTYIDKLNKHTSLINMEKLSKINDLGVKGYDINDENDNLLLLRD